MIGVIDYKAGNAPSVINALCHIGAEHKGITTPQDLVECDGIILPGVGSAKATMQSLGEMGLIEPIKEHIKQNKYFLGICVGFQILFEHSEEGDCDCLAIFPGEVCKFDKDEVRVPQIGWNRVAFVREDPILEYMPAFDYFYFVNSYYVYPDAPDLTLGRTEYGKKFCSMASRGNCYGSQFHLEKSADPGLRILANFDKLTCTNPQ